MTAEETEGEGFDKKFNFFFKKEEVGLLRFSASSCVSFGQFYFEKNFSVPPERSSRSAESCSRHSHITPSPSAEALDHPSPVIRTHGLRSLPFVDLFREPGFSFAGFLCCLSALCFIGLCSDLCSFLPFAYLGLALLPFLQLRGEESTHS